jgi:hypothetical protein
LKFFLDFDASDYAAPAKNFAMIQFAVARLMSKSSRLADPT